MQRSLLRVAVVASLLPLAACGEVWGPEGRDPGVVTFTYEGAESGAYRAVGRRPPDWATATHAAGRHFPPYPETHVFAYALGADGLADQMWLSGWVVEAGTWPFGSSTGTPGFEGELAFDASHRTNRSRAVYRFVSGSVVLEPFRDGRVRGRFEGVAVRLDAPDTLRILEGRFDVPDDLGPPLVDVRGAP